MDINCPHYFNSGNHSQGFAPQHVNAGYYLQPTPPPRTLPVHIPFPSYIGQVTIATLDHDGNLTIKVDQTPAPA